jgi:hypothetical protein
MKLLNHMLLVTSLFSTCLAFAQAKPDSCTMTPKNEGQVCSGLYIKNSRGQILVNCQDQFAATASYSSLMKSGICTAFECKIQALSECSENGGYAVTNEKNEMISKCETGRAAIDVLHFFTDAGVCATK